MSEKVLVDRELLKELVSSLEGEVESRYSNGIKDHPAMRRDYECDIEPVIRGKELLAAAPAAPVVQSGPAVQKILDLILGECKYWHHRDEARRGGFAALYAKAKEVADAAPPANDAALVEALERASKVMWSAECNLDVEAQEIERVLTAYRAALAGKGGE